MNEDLNRTGSIPESTDLLNFLSLLAHNSIQYQSRTDALTHASASLTLTSLIIAPVGLALNILLYLTDRPAYIIVAKYVALLEAILTLNAAIS